jgi:hypothetical protein
MPPLARPPFTAPATVPVPAPDTAPVPHVCSPRLLPVSHPGLIGTAPPDTKGEHMQVSQSSAIHLWQRSCPPSDEPDRPPRTDSRHVYAPPPHRPSPASPFPISSSSLSSSLSSASRAQAPGSLSARAPPAQARTSVASSWASAGARVQLLDVQVSGCWRAGMHVRLWTSRSRRADTRVRLWTCGCRCAGTRVWLWTFGYARPDVWVSV